MSLIGSQKAEFNRAAGLRTWILRVQMTIGLLAAGSIPVQSGQILYLTALAALGLAGLWFFLWVELSRSRSHAERLRRATLIVGGLGLSLGGAELLELTREGRASREEAARLVDPGYFASARPAGVPRLVDMLEESAIWTSNLATIAARETALVLGALGVVLIGSLLVAAIWTTPSMWELVARMIMSALAALLSADFIGSWLSYRNGAASARRVVDRLQGARGGEAGLEPVVIILGDYNAAVEAMPTFSSGLYPRHKKRLNDDYRMYLTGPQ